VTRRVLGHRWTRGLAARLPLELGPTENLHRQQVGLAREDFRHDGPKRLGLRRPPNPAPLSLVLVVDAADVRLTVDAPHRADADHQAAGRSP
jgi:hypothetical protein